MKSDEQIIRERLEPRPGFVVFAYIADDGAVVVQIDTPEGTDDHETSRVYMNEAIVGSWTWAVPC